MAKPWQAALQMRIHIQNPVDDPLFLFSHDMWDAAVARWRKLVESFTGGDPEVSRGLGKAWADRANWPADTREQTAPFANPKVWEFIKKASGGC